MNDFLNIENVNSIISKRKAIGVFNSQIREYLLSKMVDKATVIRTIDTFQDYILNTSPDNPKVTVFNINQLKHTHFFDKNKTLTPIKLDARIDYQVKMDEKEITIETIGKKPTLRFNIKIDTDVMSLRIIDK